MARVFLAFPATGRVEASAQRFSSALLQAGFEGRPVPGHQLHLTLLFMGNDVPLNQEFLDFMDEAVTRAMAKFPWPTLRMSRWVGLPDKWTPHAVAIAPDKPSPPLRELYERVTYLLSDLGPFPPRLVPHLTLMRPKQTGHWNQLPPVALYYPLTRLVLYQSQTSRHGAVHTPLHMWSTIRP